MIPKWIHQTWKTKEPDPFIDDLRATWQFPGFKYSFYDDNDIDLFIQRHFDGRIYRNYKRIVNGTLKADFFRYCVLYVHGGVYVDVDLACLKPLDTVIDFFTDTLVTAADYQEKDHQPKNRDYRRDCVYQAFLCCQPFHPLMKYMINYMCFVMDNNLYPRDIFRIGGPEAFADAYDRLYRNVSPKKYHLREANNDVLPGIKIVSHLHECEYLGYNKQVFARCQLPVSRKGTPHYSHGASDLYVKNHFKTKKCNNKQMIPPIIHQTWKTHVIPEQFRSFVDSWKDKHSDFTYRLWSDEDNLDLIRTEYPDLLELYQSISSPIMRCDLARYIILYHHGGYYIDLDVRCFKHLSCLPIEESHELVLTEEHPVHGKEYNKTRIVTNWFLAAVPKCEGLLKIIREVKRGIVRFPNVNQPLQITGPFMMTRLYENGAFENTLLLHYEYLNPIPKRELWQDPDNSLVSEKTVGMHYYVGTWLKPTNIPPVFTIITPTVGRRSLLRLKERLRLENVPYVHLVMWDEKRCEDALRPEEVEDDRTFCYIMKHPGPETRPKNHRNDVWLRALGISMARTKYIKCCDDDTWPEENHLERVKDFMETNHLDFTWCYRRMWKRNGDLIGTDRFEATGEKNRFGYTLLDNSSLFYNQKAGSILHQVFQQNQVYGDDRYTSEPLHKYCKGKLLPEILTNHCCQPELESFFEKNCT